MANYLPVSLDVENRRILIFGGGGKVYERIEKLLDYAPALTVAAERVTPSIKRLGEEKKISIVRSDGANADALISRLRPVLVIVSDVEAEKAKTIFTLCKKSGTEIYTEDRREYSTVLFPSVIRRKNISVTVTAAGASPDAVKQLRDYIENALTAVIDGVPEYVDALRRKLSEGGAMLKSGKFATMYREFLEAAMRANGAISADDMAQIMGKYVGEAE